MQYAVIDVGSNSIRYMDAGGKQLQTTRLAEGLAGSGRLSAAAMQRSLGAISAFLQLARQRGLEPVGYATSAVRDAQNGPEFVAMVRALGLELEVLSGEAEARLALRGAAQGGGLVDIGGGSLQLAGPGFALSRPLGCVRLKELAGPAEGLGELEAAVRRSLAGAGLPPLPTLPRWAGVGGTITTLAALKCGLSGYSSAAVNATTLTQEDVGKLVQELFLMGQERRSHPLLKERHDIILFGALAAGLLMELCGIPMLHATDRDGMEGYLAYRLEKANR